MTQIGTGVSGESWNFFTCAPRASHADYKDGASSRVTNTRFGEWDFKTGIAYAGGKFKNDL